MTYSALEWIAVLLVNSVVGHYILERIVHIATITSMVAIRNCEWK